MWTKTQKKRLGSAISIANEILESPDDTDISFCAGILATVQALLGDPSWLEDAARIARKGITEAEKTEIGVERCE